MAGATRRAMLAAPAIATALPALADASPRADRGDWATFVKMMSWAHPNGRATALQAFKAGVSLEDLDMIVLRGLSGAKADKLPMLMFNGSGGFRVFRPAGED